MADQSPEKLCAIVADALADAYELYGDLLLDLAEFAGMPADETSDEKFLDLVRGTGYDVGLFLLALARSVEETALATHDELIREAAGLMRSARPLIDSLTLLIAAGSRKELESLSLASLDEVRTVFEAPKAVEWIGRHRPPATSGF